MRNVFPSVFRFPVLCQKLARVDNNCVLIRSNSAQFNIHSFCQTIISPLQKSIRGLNYKRTISISHPQQVSIWIKMSPVFTNDPQMTGLFNYLIISRIIKLTLSRKLRLISCCYIYIVSSCSMSFLNLFLPMVILIAGDYDCFNDPVLLQDGPSVSLTSRSHLLVPRCGVNNGQW